MHYVICQVRRFFIVTVLLLAALMVQAQQDVSFGHYWAMEPSFNPASAGKEEKLNVVVAYAMQLAGFEHNPKTMYAAADMPFYAMNAYHGVGVQILNDDIGLFSHKRIGLQYAYKKSLFKGTLSGGVQVSMLSEGFTGSKLEVIDDGDDALPKSDVTGTGVDLSVGLYYSHRNWYVGISALHLNSPKVELGETNEYNISSSYYLTGGYNIRLRNPFLSVQPSFLVRSDMVSWRGDVTGRLTYKHDEKMMYLGVTYSPKTSVTVLIGGNFHGIHLGYSYEVYPSAISIGNGSHELFVGYQTELNLFKKGRNLHKSVRYL